MKTNYLRQPFRKLMYPRMGRVRSYLDFARPALRAATEFLVRISLQTDFFGYFQSKLPEFPAVNGKLIFKKVLRNIKGVNKLQT